ncbi:hypothetical protein AVEN_96322-1 [Araneus ventricosus]|uniref:MATH domain-containing protein n=1 Tax=Araneus ventricosus TaxID=182803 RepID=A0A4Y2Q8Z2_ARAVE|nr:hypothetical protein AVEN_96322-1 [Araneus ventricosus]
MATKAGDETNGYTFQWKIENISHCWLKRGQKIVSPTFIAETLEGAKWSLWLYPKGYADENFITFYLRRECDWDEPALVAANYQLAFLGKDGSFLKENSSSKYIFDRNGWSVVVTEEREKVFLAERAVFLPEDTLTVQCTIWNKGEKPVEPKHLSARTVFKVNRRSFVWRIDKFSTLKPGVRNNFKDDLIDFDLVVNETIDLTKTLDLNIISFNKSIQYFSFKTSFVDTEGEKEDSGDMYVIEYFDYDFKPGVSSTL